MRLGGPVTADGKEPAEWAAEVRRQGYGAAYCPVQGTEGEAVERAFRAAAEQAGLIIAEVGAWSNPISPDEATRRAAISLCQERLALADRMGALCCVNIAGSRSAQWDGPHAANLDEDTFGLIVDTVRQIVDAVRPRHTFYTLETMPWAPPDSTESYRRLVAAIERPAFAVHFDPVNVITSPRLYYANGALIRQFLEGLGPLIKSCHAKDITLSGQLTLHLDETRPGLGNLDYATLLRGLEALDPQMPLMLEHLAQAEEYPAAAAHVRAVAAEVGVSLLP